MYYTCTYMPTIDGLLFRQMPRPNPSASDNWFVLHWENWEGEGNLYQKQSKQVIGTMLNCIHLAMLTIMSLVYMYIIFYTCTCIYTHYIIHVLLFICSHSLAKFVLFSVSKLVKQVCQN